MHESFIWRIFKQEIFVIVFLKQPFPGVYIMQNTMYVGGRLAAWEKKRRRRAKIKVGGKEKGENCIKNRAKRNSSLLVITKKKFATRPGARIWTNYTIYTPALFRNLQIRYDLRAQQYRLQSVSIRSIDNPEKRTVTSLNLNSTVHVQDTLIIDSRTDMSDLIPDNENENDTSDIKLE